MARVLVVDDDRALLRALTVGLSGRGHDVLSARTGSEGLTRVAVDAPEVVVLDLGLPDLDGIDVCRRIRQWSQVPIIVLSAGRPHGIPRQGGAGGRPRGVGRRHLVVRRVGGGAPAHPGR